MSAFASPAARTVLIVVAVAALTSACSSVDLGPRYDPPPVRMPQPLPSAPVQAAPVAQPSAIPPTQPMPQTLPPLGSPPAVRWRAGCASGPLPTHGPA